ncbi:protein of unknown function [Amycolatopsis pretoriensis]|uniref:Rv2525c-like glycoside hydrolase-like domain-containing protein n=1 Tax=Amycolatopsis pretoriensis TaxID=218821 RepID=A0A1H5R7R5_9PSEU|nr:glycoside hydrolase domain-containing protein [Amycolatopsis pretoriensis]SEF34425.1 protein of unknown function [Amycolatopsis pretoriensis]
MTQFADYSAGRPSGAALKAAGFTGVVRYVGLGSAGKRLTAAEYRDLVAAGVQVLLVAELGVGDSWGTATDDDYARGKANAAAALNDAHACGIPDRDIVIFAASDAQPSATWHVTDTVKYVRGFRDVLGLSRTGHYGFAATNQAVHAAGVASFYWRCGAEPSAADKGWVHLWQRNRNPTTRVVAGVPCDINDVYRPISPVAPSPVPTPAVEEDDAMDPIQLPVSESTTYRTIPWNGRAAVLNLITTNTDLFVARPGNWGPGGGTGGGDPTNPNLPRAGDGWRITANLPGAFTVPGGTTRIFLAYSCASLAYAWPVATA